jgi:hypothetical protein
MWVKFVVDGKVVDEADVASDAQAVKHAEAIAAGMGTVEIWTPKYVVVKATEYKSYDYGKYKQNELEHGKDTSSSS